jgi:hypothetical protein
VRERHAPGADNHPSQAFARHPGDVPTHRYALLDFDDAYQLPEVGIFSPRYAYLSTWRIDELLKELARCQACLIPA